MNIELNFCIPPPQWRTAGSQKKSWNTIHQKDYNLVALDSLNFGAKYSTPEWRNLVKECDGDNLGLEA
jgi:hypothetical protein